MAKKAKLVKKSSVVKPKGSRKPRVKVKKLKPFRISKALESRFPKTAPVLGPEDMFDGWVADDLFKPTKCCLLGHLNLWIFGVPAVIGDSENSSYELALATVPAKAIVKASRECLKPFDKVLDDFATEKLFNIINIVEINDDVCLEVQLQYGVSADSLRARIWNLAMALLGYRVGNPEAKNVDYT